jgi:hypothetical protein
MKDLVSQSGPVFLWLLISGAKIARGTSNPEGLLPGMAQILPDQPVKPEKSAILQ